jgi:hypothetical protein
MAKYRHRILHHNCSLGGVDGILDEHEVSEGVQDL